MSVSKFAYDPEICNDAICPGDCEYCRVWLDKVDEAAEEEYEEELKTERQEAGAE